jgi:hypothetical protein
LATPVEAPFNELLDPLLHSIGVAAKMRFDGNQVRSYDQGEPQLSLEVTF